jgi:hypothetical protein
MRNLPPQVGLTHRVGAANPRAMGAGSIQLPKPTPAKQTSSLEASWVLVKRAYQGFHMLCMWTPFRWASLPSPHFSDPCQYKPCYVQICVQRSGRLLFSPNSPNGRLALKLCRVDPFPMTWMSPSGALPFHPVPVSQETIPYNTLLSLASLVSRISLHPPHFDFTPTTT